jgi:lipopolysaccharide export system protein LptA
MIPSQVKNRTKYFHFVALIALLLASAGVQAQTAAPAKAANGAPKETVVDSDTFKLDLSQHSGVFIGNVHVVDPSFEMTSDEMTLYFDKDNKIERMVASGNINLKQGDKQSATSREAEYTVADKKLKLTGNPIVQQGDNKVTGAVIYLYPGSDRMDVEGRSKVRFYSTDNK